MPSFWAGPDDPETEEDRERMSAPEPDRTAEDRGWIKNWRDGMFSSASRDPDGWPIEMHGVVEAWGEALDRLDALVAENTRLREALTETLGVATTLNDCDPWYAENEEIDIAGMIARARAALAGGSE